MPINGGANAVTENKKSSPTRKAPDKYTQKKYKFIPIGNRHVPQVSTSYHFVIAEYLTERPKVCSQP